MILAVEQPYFLPYIGYWQLLNVVDVFVILDDVNFIKRGFINRNNILINNKPYRFSIPIKEVSQNKMIKDTKLCFNERDRKSFLSQIKYAYGKAPQFKEVYSMIGDIVNNPDEDLTRFIQYSLRTVAQYIGISTQIVRSSDINKNNTLTGQDRVIEICKKLGGDMYINPTGGRHLYDKNAFNKESIDLVFLDTRHEKIIYRQFDNIFVSMLSIIDIMMFNTVEKIQKFLKEYDLNE